MSLRSKTPGGHCAQACPHRKLLRGALSRVLASMGTVPEALEIKRPVQDKKSSPSLTIGVPMSGVGSVASGTTELPS
jgi:hypothetical protein